MTTINPQPRFSLHVVNTVKWAATVIQLIGYGLTGLNVVPWNIFAFFAGIFLWFAVGVMWKDKAIMVVHVGAFISLFLGYLNS
ncbi:DUF6552 family protein [Antarctobacter jejuensis]|uniref:DUF6552 family protein n=1 Tax=Antarctobacter jejuensis TaxID=1439938 RepID=UPI003FD3D5DA